MANKLGTGESFPRITLQLVDGRGVALPEGVDGRYKVVLFYRGHW
jgi:peroxiredoxin